MFGVWFVSCEVCALRMLVFAVVCGLLFIAVVCGLVVVACGRIGLLLLFVGIVVVGGYCICLVVVLC